MQKAKVSVWNMTRYPETPEDQKKRSPVTDLGI